MAAPIALFTYRRPEHVARTLDSLRMNPQARETTIYVFSDAARDDSAKPDVARVRQIINAISGFAEVRVIMREANLGLAQNITGGISKVLSKHEDVIVVEDDILASPRFLSFMNDSLAYYRNELRVASISGYCYPLRRPVPETFFIKGADCWGWATWADRWKLYNPNGLDLLAQIRARGLEQQFNFDGTMDYMQMLRDQIDGRNDSWAVRWHASCYLQGKLILYPGKSLVQNIGLDGSGTHIKSKDSSYDVDVSAAPVSVGGIPIEENQQAREAFKEYFLTSQAKPANPTKPESNTKISSIRRARSAMGLMLRYFGLR